MKIESVYIKNFRCFKEDTIYFDDYTCLVGANGAGKSTVFSALHVFFRHYKDSKTDLSKLSDKDFHHLNTTEPIIITVTFTDLSLEAQQDLQDYFRNGKLIVTAMAKFDEGTQRAEVKQYGNRLGFEDFRIYFEKEKAGDKVAELVVIYNDLKDKYTELPQVKTKELMANALREYETLHPEQCVLIPSEDQFYGATRGNRLAAHLQWVFIAASKDVTEEGEESKTSALGQLLVRTVRAKVNFTARIAELRKKANEDYATLLSEEQKNLDELSRSLKTRLSQWAHPSIDAQVKWKQDPEKSVKVEEPVAAIEIGERGFEGELSRFGHGLQRSYMLALLQELNDIDDANSPTLILGIEEPELYQHPPQARYLAETLLEIADDNTQVMVCSHSPYFIPKSDFEKVRVVKEIGSPTETKNTRTTYALLSKFLADIGTKPITKSGIVAKLYPYLSPAINEMFFCKVPVFVEGIEDIAFIKTYVELSGKSNDFRKYGCHLINADKKSNIIEPLAVAKLLDIPSFVIFDCDTDATKPEQIADHKRDNKLLLAIQGHGAQSEWQANHILKDNLAAWATNLGDSIKPEIPNWEKYYNQACSEFGNAGGLKKNPLVVARTLELAWDAGEKSPTLIGLIETVIKFAKANQ